MWGRGWTVTLHFIDLDNEVCNLQQEDVEDGS